MQVFCREPSSEEVTWEIQGNTKTEVAAVT